MEKKKKKTIKKVQFRDHVDSLPTLASIDGYQASSLKKSQTLNFDSSSEIYKRLKRLQQLGEPLTAPVVMKKIDCIENKLKIKNIVIKVSPDRDKIEFVNNSGWLKSKTVKSLCDLKYVAYGLKDRHIRVMTRDGHETSLPWLGFTLYFQDESRFVLLGKSCKDVDEWLQGISALAPIKKKWRKGNILWARLAMRLKISRKPNHKSSPRFLAIPSTPRKCPSPSLTPTWCGVKYPNWELSPEGVLVLSDQDIEPLYLSPTVTHGDD